MNEKARQMPNAECRMTKDEWATPLRGSASSSSFFIRHSVIRHFAAALPLAALLLSSFPGLAAQGGPPSPKEARAVGTITARLGTGVTVALAEGAAVQANEELVVGRPALLVAVAKGNEVLAAWGDWQEAGRIRLRVPRPSTGSGRSEHVEGRSIRYWTAFVEDEKPLTGVGGESVANIRPGDVVYRPAGGKP